MSGAWCSSVNLAPGAFGDLIGGTPARVPVWEIDLLHTPRARGLSFIPPIPASIRYACQHVQHMQKALKQMNVKLTEVVADITGVTGMAISQAILRGQRDTLELAKLRNDQRKRTEAPITRALYGNWRAEHLFALKQVVELHAFYRQQLQPCDAEAPSQLRTFDDRSAGRALLPRRKRRRRKANDTDRSLGTGYSARDGRDEVCCGFLYSSPPS